MWRIKREYGRVFGDVDDAFQFVHSFDAANPFNLGNGERTATFAIDAYIATGRCVQGIQEQVIVRQSVGDGAYFFFCGVVEMTARGKNFDRPKTRTMNLGEQFAIQLFGNEDVSREDPLHKLRV